ncbi:unnamed protein product [Diatraea saccharalis]|uniref:Uncharacterized protein n=1 Tax=Diatraea saccharalis TaxID=40085 RepID=A0A9N9WH81_9NEOP|nr:unnamed protein product [Diatraea saccharalis]
MQPQAGESLKKSSESIIHERDAKRRNLELVRSLIDTASTSTGIGLYGIAVSSTSTNTPIDHHTEEIRRKTRERVQKHRNKKKELLDDNQLESTSYSNPKTLGKAKSRVKKALPACPLRKKAVLQKIMEEIDIVEPSTSTQKSKHCISDEILAKVKQFYERDDISRQVPGLKDVKTVREDRAIRDTKSLPYELTWYFWKEDSKGKLCKTVQSGDLDELQKHLIDLTPSFKVHSFVKNSQAKAYEKDKEAVTKNKNEVASLLQIDFLENYTCLAQDEVQSFHWVQPQVTLFTISLWHSGKHFPIVIVSDNRHHTKDTIVPFLQRTLEELPDNIKEVHVWSNGPASQFKNRFIAASLPLLEKISNKKIIWNYFATSHGKGPVDGIGGALKRLVRSKVISRVENVFNAQQFTQVGNKYSSVKVINVNEEEIERRFANLKLKDVFDAAVHVEGIAKIHNIYTSNCVVKTESVTIDSNLIKEKSFHHTVYGSDESDISDDDVPLSIIRKKC